MKDTNLHQIFVIMFLSITTACDIDATKIWTFHSDMMECNRTTPLGDELCGYGIVMPKNVLCTVDPKTISSELRASTWIFICTTDSYWNVHPKVICPEGSDPCGDYTVNCRVILDVTSGSTWLLIMAPLMTMILLGMCVTIVMVLAITVIESYGISTGIKRKAK